MNQFSLTVLAIFFAVNSFAQDLPFYIATDTLSIFRLDFYVRNVIDDRSDLNIWADSIHNPVRYKGFRYDFEQILKQSIVAKPNAEPILIKVSDFKVWENQTDSGLYAKEYINVIYYLYANLKFIEVYSNSYVKENTSNRKSQGAHMQNIRAIIREMYNDFESNSGYKNIEY